jgi:hypothetical protein
MEKMEKTFVMLKPGALQRRPDTWTLLNNNSRYIPLNSLPRRRGYSIPFNSGERALIQII